MAGIFISYRRDDAAGHAGRIYDQLTEDFPDAHIFMDVDAIEPGVDFVQRIESAVDECELFLAVVGRNWAAATDSRGQRRLDDPDDYVRRELAAALQRQGIRVIPVLVAGAAMPTPEDLPDELAAFTRRNALVVSDIDWRAGIARLVSTVRDVVGDGGPVVQPRRGEGEEVVAERRAEAGIAPLVVALAGAGLLVAATALRLDTLIHPDFGDGTVPYLGTVVAPASIFLALGAVYAVLKAWRSDAGPLATGLLLGFGIGGLAKYVSLLGQRGASENPDQLGSPGSLLLGLAGSAVLAAVAVFWLLTGHRGRALPTPVIGRVLAPAGAIAVAAATFVPFNVAKPESEAARQILVERSGWEASEPLAVAVAIVLVVVLGSAMRQLVVSGVFIALGLLSALFWIRYVGVPLLQMLHADNLARVHVGGFIGLAGSALVWRAGVAGRDETLSADAYARTAELAPERRGRATG